MKICESASSTLRRRNYRRRLAAALLAVLLIGSATMTPALADGLRRGTDAHDKSSTRAVRGLALAAARGDARAQAQLGFIYENGFGVPQNYVVAADLYQSAAAKGDVFGQSRLGLSYHKGHDVPQSVVWLNLAAAGFRADRPIIIAGFAMPLPRR